MATIGERVRELRKERGMNRSELARATDLTHSALQQLESGETKAPTPENLFKIADALNVDARYLVTGAGSPSPVRTAEQVASYQVTRAVPLISWTTAGIWADISDPYQPGDGEQMIHTTAKVGRHAFALRIRGDSMEPRIPDGSVVIIDPERSFDHGSIVLAKRVADQQATLKQLWYDGAHPMLRPINDKYPMLDMPEDTRIIGVAVHSFTEMS
jgi:SOS-response transcriptional repressor LexA